MRKYLALGAIAGLGALILYGAGILDAPSSAAAAPTVDVGVPPLPALAAPSEPPFPEPGSSCWAYFESVEVTGAAAPVVILGLPTEKAVLLYQYSIAHNEPVELSRITALAHRIDANAHLRIVKRTASSIQGTVLDGSSVGETLFIPTDNCHARWASSVVQGEK
jgi:hypothetical protein